MIFKYFCEIFVPISEGPPLTLSQTSTGFYMSAVQVFGKHYPFGELSTIFIQFEIVVCKLFQFGRVLNLSFGKGLKGVILISFNSLPNGKFLD